jgi:D-glycero-D-manno-heptose 1,7-bisphosphate phosphatase
MIYRIRYNCAMVPAIFLDRDGVIIKNRSKYIRAWSHVEFYKRSLASMSLLSETPYQIVLVTNQSAVGRGLISTITANSINHQIVEKIEKSGGRVDGVFMCPHRPEDHCACRKPKPGMLIEAAEALAIDLKRSVLIGDAISDLQAAQSAGVAKTILVLTGRGRSQIQLQPPPQLQPFLIFQSLWHAVNHRESWLP